MYLIGCDPPNSQNKFWWICEFGLQMNTTPNNRNYGKDFPYCSNQKVGYEDFGNKITPFSVDFEFK